MTEAEQVLRELIHAVRTPVGVAQGYVRLLQEQRLGAAEDRDRAFARTMEALGSISRHCEDAMGLLQPAGLAIAVTTATALATYVEARLRDRGVAVDTIAVDQGAQVRVHGDAQRLAEAIGLVLAGAWQPGGPAPSLFMETRQSLLRFSTAPQGQRPPDDSETGTPFDPWGGRGLAVALACRTIAHAGGRVWQTDASLAVAIPLENTCP